MHARRPLHHNAHALRNVDYMVDEDELVRMSRSAPPCDGESDLGDQPPALSLAPPLLSRSAPASILQGSMHSARASPQGGIT